jgi:hypothetical protein
MKQGINIRVKTIKKNREYQKIKLNWDVHLMPKCGLMEPLIKLSIEKTKQRKFVGLSKNA